MVVFKFSFILWNWLVTSRGTVLDAWVGICPMCSQMTFPFPNIPRYTGFHITNLQFNMLSCPFMGAAFREPRCSCALSCDDSPFVYEISMCGSGSDRSRSFLLFPKSFWFVVLLMPFLICLSLRMLLTNLRNGMLRHAGVNQMLVLILSKLVKGNVFGDSYWYLASWLTTLSSC
jgi:hypothetical protein